MDEGIEVAVEDALRVSHLEIRALVLDLLVRVQDVVPDRFAAEAEKTRAAEAALWQETSLSTDFGSSTTLPNVRF